MGRAKAWVTSFRLRTLPLAFSGWLMGIAMASTMVRINWIIAVLNLLTAFLLQILSNIANDYGDAVSGVDSEKRDGPKRMVQSGQISKQSMRNAMILFVLLSLGTGSALIYLAFPDKFYTAMVFLLVGLIGIAAAIKYTVGKNPYGYAGFGDLFVFIFFGIVLVYGSFYLQVQEFDGSVLLPSMSLGCLSIAVLNVNNIRDIESDKASGKHSIPVRIGRKKAVIYHAVLLFAALGLTSIYSFLHLMSWTQFIFLGILILFVKNVLAVSKNPLSELDPYLKQMAISTLLYAVLFSIGLVVHSL